MSAYCYTGVIMRDIVPLLSFVDLYALTHTCKSLRHAIDDASDVWTALLSRMYHKTDVPPRPNAVAKRCFLALLPNVCWACWRFDRSILAIESERHSSVRHHMCTRCVVELGLHRARAPERARRIYHLTDELMERDGMMRRNSAENRPVYALSDDVERLRRDADAPLRPMPAVPYICRRVLTSVRRSRPASVHVAYVKNCVCGVALSTHEAIQCRLNMCEACCDQRVHVVRRCRYHRLADTFPRERDERLRRKRRRSSEFH